MKIELVPVIEIGYCNQGVKPPKNYPFWDHPNEWDSYRNETLTRAGFFMPMEPYIPGAFIFSPTSLSQRNLKKIIEDHLKDSGGGEPDWNDLIPLFGGYVLRKDGSDCLFPQCCSDLGSFEAWKKVSFGSEIVPWTGHPEPSFEFLGDEIVIHCDSKFDVFVPPTENRISISRIALQEAIHVTDHYLRELDKRIAEILADAGIRVSSSRFIHET